MPFSFHEVLLRGIVDTLPLKVKKRSANDVSPNAGAGTAQASNRS